MRPFHPLASLAAVALLAVACQGPNTTAPLGVIVTPSTSPATSPAASPAPSVSPGLPALPGASAAPGSQASSPASAAPVIGAAPPFLFGPATPGASAVPATGSSATPTLAPSVLPSAASTPAVQATPAVAPVTPGTTGVGVSFAGGTAPGAAGGFRARQVAGVTVTSFVVNVTSIEVSADGSAWQQIYQANPPVAVELIRQAGDSFAISNISLDPGHYKGLRFVIDGGTVVNNGTAYAVPATTFPILEDFDVAGQKVTGLVIDFGIVNGVAPLTIDSNTGTATVRAASVGAQVTALTFTFIPADGTQPRGGGLWMSGQASGTYAADGKVRSKDGTHIATATFASGDKDGQLAFANGRQGTFQVTAPGAGGTFSGGASGVFVANPDSTGGTWYVNSDTIATAEGTFTYTSAANHAQGGTFAGTGRVSILATRVEVGLGGTFTESSAGGATGGDWALNSATYLGIDYFGFFSISPGYVLKGSFVYS